MTKKNEMSILHSSAAEYLTFVAATGDNKESMEMRYEDENIWLTQKIMATLYDVTVEAINQRAVHRHYLERIVSLYLDYAELQAERKIPMSMEDWATRLDGFLEFNGNALLTGPKKITAEQVKLHAETQFEKYRIKQDRLFESDFDLYLRDSGIKTEKIR